MQVRKIIIAHSWTDVGINIQTKAVAKKLSETADVIFLSQARIRNTEIISNNRLKVIEWPNKRPNSIKDFVFLIKLIRKEKPQTFIVHFGATNLSMIVSWIMGVKYRIAWMHTLSSQYYLDSSTHRIARLAIFFRRQAYRLATHVIALNEYAKRDAVAGFKVNPQKISVIYNGIDNTLWKQKEHAVCKSFRFCGRLDKSKGVDVLIKAFACAYHNNKDIILEIAGRGSEEDNIRTMIKEEKLEDAVKMRGYFFQYTESLKFVSEAYCIVVPSRRDNFPTVILEALSNGVPVITTNTGGMTDMIENGKEGFLLEAEDAGGLAAAINRLASNEGLRNEMSKQALSTFDTKFSMAQHVLAVNNFMQNLDAAL